MNKTNEFSFILKPSNIDGAGLGVFTTHDIEKDTELRVLGENPEADYSLRNRDEVPEQFRTFCVCEGEKLLCPKDFGHMTIGWYMNHSSKNFNAFQKDQKFYTARDIKAGEEILIDYNSFNEPEKYKEEYYKN